MLKITVLLACIGLSFSLCAQKAVHLSPEGSCAHFKSAIPSAAVPNLDHSFLSDTFDIQHTHLSYDFRHLPQTGIIGKAELQVVMLHQTSVFRFELDGLGLLISSAKINDSTVTQGGSGSMRELYIPSGTWAVNDTALVEIWFAGPGGSDFTGWGGWHHSSPYFFNLGVGFGANPHSYGRSMFPTFDNFIEHSTYSFDIITVAPRRAYANGIRTNLVRTGDTIVQSWSCTHPIPSYLVGIAISNYSELRDTLTTSMGTVPSLITARPNDTANVRRSFRNLQGILNSFESRFGPYIWDKVGYAMTTQGAMEHATSVHLPVSLANGTLMGEDIIAHELAHHWWGNLITCEKAEDMWINEGMAEFSSHLYEEDVYDRDRYMQTVRGNQLQVLNYAHAQDGGYMALNGVDHGTTYGMTVYNKGACVGHNLRGYLGDSAFSYASLQIFDNHAFENFTSARFESLLTQYTGVNMSDFFDDQVYAPGHVAVSASIISENNNGGLYDIEVEIRQHRQSRPDYLKDAPMLLKVYMLNDTLEMPVRVTNNMVRHSLYSLPSKPVYVTINEGDDYLTGTTYKRAEGNGYGIFILDEAKARLIVNNSSSPYSIYIAHHWAGPEGPSPAGARLSANRFWTIDGVNAAQGDVELRLTYDARAQSGGLDADLVSSTEDSLGLYYRANSNSPWSGYPFYTVNPMGSPTDGFGNITLHKIVPGEYVFANTNSVGIAEGEKAKGLLVYPNPADGTVVIELFVDGTDSSLVEVLSTDGKTVLANQSSVNQGWNTIELDVSSLASGSYIVRTEMGEQKVLIAH